MHGVGYIVFAQSSNNWLSVPLRGNRGRWHYFSLCDPTSKNDDKCIGRSRKIPDTVWSQTNELSVWLVYMFATYMNRKYDQNIIEF